MDAGKSIAFVGGGVMMLQQMQKPIYLEISTLKNISWYKNLDLNYITNLISDVDCFTEKGFSKVIMPIADTDMHVVTLLFILFELAVFA